MSLEVAIQENTQAIRDLIAAISKGVPITATQVEQVVTEAAPTEVPAKAGKTKATAPSAANTSEQSTTETVASAPSSKSLIEEVANEPEPAAPTYQDAAKLVTSVAAKLGRPAALKMLAEFGTEEHPVEKLPDVQPEDYAGVIAAAKKLLGV